MKRGDWRLSLVALVGILMMTGVAHAGETMRLGGTQGTVLPVVNQDQLAGKWKQFTGELKQKWAEFTEDDLMLIEGRIDRYAGRQDPGAVWRPPGRGQTLG